MFPNQIKAGHYYRTVLGKKRFVVRVSNRGSVTWLYHPPRTPDIPRSQPLGEFARRARKDITAEMLA